MATPQLALLSRTKIEWAEVVLALQLHQNPNAIIPPAGGGWRVCWNVCVRAGVG